MSNKAPVIIKVGGETVQVTPKNGTDFSLEEMQNIVGGYIEFCECTDPDLLLIIDEEGKMKMKEINWTATNHYKYARARGKIIDFIVGDVLLCPRSMVR